MAGLPGPEVGGIAGLVAFLREHGDAVEADLQRFHSLALSDLTSGRLTWRRLRVLLGNLPRESATARAVNGEDVEWGLGEHLLAACFDALQVANWQRAARKTRAPKPIPRPGVGKGDRAGDAKGVDQDALRAYLDKLKPRTEVAEDGV